MKKIIISVLFLTLYNQGTLFSQSPSKSIFFGEYSINYIDTAWDIEISWHLNICDKSYHLDKYHWKIQDDGISKKKVEDEFDFGGYNKSGDTLILHSRLDNILLKLLVTDTMNLRLLYDRDKEIRKGSYLHRYIRYFEDVNCSPNLHDRNINTKWFLQPVVEDQDTLHYRMIIKPSKETDFFTTEPIIIEKRDFYK